LDQQSQDQKKIVDDEKQGTEADYKDMKASLDSWEQTKNKNEASDIDLASVVHSMQRFGRSANDVLAELRSALDCNPLLLPNVVSLSTALLRDDAVELLDGVVKLLEDQNQTIDTAVYAGLMKGKLRRKEYTEVSAIAARVDAAGLTPQMRAMLISAATNRARLDEALGHIRQMPVTEEGGRCALTPAVVGQVLALAAKEQRVVATAYELQRVHAKLDTKQFDNLLLAEIKRSKGQGAYQELVEAGSVLQVLKSSSTYQALSSAYSASNNSLGLRNLFDELDAEAAKGPSGITVGEPLALTLVEAAKSFRDNKLVSRAVELYRLACVGAPGARVLSSACAALVALERHDAACDFYESEMIPRGIHPDAALTGALLKAAAQGGRTALAQRLSDHAATMKSSTTTGSNSGAKDEMSRHASMIKAHARDRDLASATKVFSRLRSSGTPMSSLIYNCYLDACVQCGDLESAKSHFQEMKTLKFLDVVGYNTLLKSYLAKGFTQEAHALLKEMTAAGLQANKVTFNELLHAKVLAKDPRGLWNLVEEMQHAGVRANSVTCSILLKSLTVASDPKDVRRVLGLIDTVEESIDEVLFSSVIEACIRIKQLDLLSDLMRRYRQKGGFVNLTAPTYGSMIKAYGQAGDVARVRELWHEMEERGVKPTSITLGCMTEALVVNGQTEEAWQLIHSELQSEERKACINTVIYSTVLKGFAVSKHIDKVFNVYKEMRAKGIPCNTITYNTMLDACAKCSAMSRASDLLVDMKDSCVEPDIITYSTIVKGYCMEGDVDRAFSVLEDMKSDEKFAPDEIMYNSILDGCAKQHRTDDALKILEEMKSSGIIPSNYTLSILVKLLGHARRLTQAFRLVEELSTQHGFRPNVQVYTCMVQACVLNRRLEKAMALHDTMVADVGCRTDEKFYAVLARGCLQLHQPLKAAEVVRAAYGLPGHSLAESTRPNARPVGVEARALEEVASRLQAGGKEEQDALAQLNAELFELRGVRIGDCQASRRGGNYNTRDEAARRRGTRGGYNNRNGK
jgi:pentatricopeptide repeat protein